MAVTVQMAPYLFELRTLCKGVACKGVACKGVAYKCVKNTGDNIM